LRSFRVLNRIIAPKSEKSDEVKGASLSFGIRLVGAFFSIVIGVVWIVESF